LDELLGVKLTKSALDLISVQATCHNWPMLRCGHAPSTNANAEADHQAARRGERSQQGLRPQKGENNNHKQNSNAKANDLSLESSEKAVVRLLVETGEHGR
jgi:hypothetical protein